jgi:hypothetical protein
MEHGDKNWFNAEESVLSLPKPWPQDKSALGGGGGLLSASWYTLQEEED